MEIGLSIKADEAFSNETIQKFAIFHLIRNLSRALAGSQESKQKKQPDVDLDAYIAQKHNLPELAKELSIKNQIVSEYTALLCVSNEPVKANDGKNPEYVNVPNLESADYYGNVEQSRYIGGGGQAVYIPASVALRRGRSQRKSGGSCGCGGGGGGYSDEPEPAIEVKPKQMEVLVGDMNSILTAFNMEGYWNFDPKVLNALKIPANALDLLVDALKQPEAVCKQIAMTLLIIRYLEVKHADTEAKWQLIRKKALRWLLSKGVDYDQFKAIILIK